MLAINKKNKITLQNKLVPSYSKIDDNVKKS